MDKDRTIRIGTRGSRLALAQTNQVITCLREKYPELKMEKVILRTKGDKILDKPLIDFGGKGAFITEFEDALLKGTIDLAVHSSKDMPMELADGLLIAGVLPRADARDVLVIRKSADKAFDVDRGFLQSDSMVIGTGSLRRQFQLQKRYPNVRCISIRGNVPTRLQKVRDGECDGVVLAAAGLERLGLLEEPDFDYYYFSYDEMVPAGGQGIIAVEGRVDDAIGEMVHSISDRNAALELETERAVLKLLDAGCHEAIGVFSKVRNEQIEIRVLWEKAGNICQKQGNTELSNRLIFAKQLADEIKQAGD